MQGAYKLCGMLQRGSSLIERLGSANGGWWVDLDYVPRGSCIIDGGVGFDVSFAREVITRAGAYAVGVDPSPASWDYVNGLHLVDYEFVLGAIIADGSFTRIYRNPIGSESCYPDHRGVGNSNYMSVGIMLSDLISQKNPSLIKLDIEGAEYGVYRQCFGVAQVCIEFHHRCVARFTQDDTEAAILDFVDAGYAIIHRTSLDEVTFLLR